MHNANISTACLNFCIKVVGSSTSENVKILHAKVDIFHITILKCDVIRHFQVEINVAKVSLVHS